MLTKIKKGLLWFFNSYIWLGLLFLVIDIVTKNVIVANKEYIIDQGSHGIVLIPGFLSINYTINTNAAFGIGLGNALANRIVYIVLASIISLIIIAVYVKRFKTLTKMYRATMMLILVGALGNLIDRIFFTIPYLETSLFTPEEVGVVDWIDFYGIWKYIFNIADSCIVVGVIMLVIYLIVLEVKDRKNKKPETLTVEQVNEMKETKEETPADTSKEEENQ